MNLYEDQNANAKDRALDLLGRLTLKEKAGQVNQRLYGFEAYIRTGSEIRLSPGFCEEVNRFQGLGVLYGLYRADPWSGKDEQTGLYRELAVKAYNLAQQYVLAHSRFRIPMLLSSECPHGHQALEGYLLPVNLALGATFNPRLAADGFRVCARQMKELGVNLALISMLDVLRDPRWGRSEECYGEDPYLSQMMAAAVTAAVQDEGVMVVAKHLAAQGETTGGVNASSARIGERELRQIHLPPARAAVLAGVKGFMAAYNDIDGIPCHANPWLLKDYLRKELGFDGIVMADGTAVDRLDRLTGDNVKSGALALASGIDVSLWDNGFGHLEEAVQAGYIKEETLDEAVFRVLRMKFEQGLFERPCLPETVRIYNFAAEPANLELARESVVLLKNDHQLLPVKDTGPLVIAVIGPGAFDVYDQLGDYTPPLLPDAGYESASSLAEGLKLTNHQGHKLRFFAGCRRDGRDEALMDEAVAGARQADLIILVLGGTSSRFGKPRHFDVNGAVRPGPDGLETAGEAGESFMDCGEGLDLAALKLPKGQRRLLKRLAALKKRMVSVVIAGRPYVITDAAAVSDSLLYCSYPGPRGGQAIAEIVFGEIEPSGRLPMSLPRSAAQLPVYYNPYASYEALSYTDLPAGPLYPFGAGGGYHRAEYQNIRLARTGDAGRTLRISFELAGSAKTAYAVPMVFIKKPEAEFAALLQAEPAVMFRTRRLAAFDKIRVSPGSKTAAVLELELEADTAACEIELQEGGQVIWQQHISLQER